MRIIHCADLHIGSAMKNLPKDKSKIRRREIIDSFFRMLDFAQRNDVRIIMIAGDFFDVGKIARSTIKDILDRIDSYPQIDFLYLTGNHDSNTLSELNGLESHPNLHYFNAADDWVYYLYGNVCIAGIDVFKQSGYGFYEKLKLDKNSFNIAVLHGDLKTIQLDRLKGKNIDYLALGDRHSPNMESQKLDSRGFYAYCGCLEGRGYDEFGDKGFFLLEIENGRLKRREFHSVAKRKYECVELDITQLDSHSKIDAALSSKVSAFNKESIIKVELTGKRKADTRIERENLERKLIDKFFYAKVEDRSRLDMNSLECGNEISLRSEFINLVKESDLLTEKKDKILEYGLKVLSGEEIEL